MKTNGQRGGFLACLIDRDGGAAVEFGILGPLLGLILAGVVDLGGVVFVKFRLDNAVSAAANYGIVHKSSVSSADGGTLASSMAAIVVSSGSTSDVDGTIVVNNGPTATISAGTTSSGGTASNANSCYCPTLSSSAVVWGVTVNCGNDCPGDGKAGKFIAIEVSRPYTALFSSYGFIDNSTVSSRAVVQVQ